MRYEDIAAINWSRLKHARKSLLEYRYRLDHPEGDKACYRRGRAGHTLILEPEKWDAEYVTWEGGRRYGKKWDEFCAEHGGKTILTVDETARAHGMAWAVRNHPVARHHLRDGLSEKTLTWTEPETGVACKARCDSVNGHLVEIKTAADIQRNRFASAAARYGYHCQLAWYADGLRHSGYELHGEPALIVVQSEPPHDVIVYNIGNDVLDQGRREYMRLLRMVLEAEEAGEWPGQAPNTEVEFALPAWAETIDDEPEKPLTMGGVVLAF